MGNVCLYCGSDTGPNPYLGDTNPDHVLGIAELEAPSLELLYPEHRQYDTFCSKEHYIRWLKGAKHRLEPAGTEEEGLCKEEGL